MVLSCSVCEKPTQTDFPTFGVSDKNEKKNRKKRTLRKKKWMYNSKSTNDTLYIISQRERSSPLPRVIGFFPSTDASVDIDKYKR